jgi:hypothetical protein
VAAEADLVIAVDSSASVSDEAAAVEQQLNAVFDLAVSAGVDLRVVALSECPTAGSISGNAGLNVPAPLGSGSACPNDGNPPSYTHVVQAIGSDAALETIVNTFPSWNSALRPSAATVFFVVTDDDAAPSTSPDQFLAWTSAQPEIAQGALSFSGYYCATNGVACANLGIAYEALRAATDGIVLDVGSLDAQPANLDELATEIVSTAAEGACRFSLPPEATDLGRVNVTLTAPTGPTDLFNVPSAASCTPSQPGWYLGGDGTFSLCPTVCDSHRGMPEQAVLAVVGCARRVAP